MVARSKLMKRRKRILPRKNNENNQNKTRNSIGIMPRELILEVLARVATSSFDDFFNAKLSCKVFNGVSEEDYIYKHVSLKKFPVISWQPLSEGASSFLKRCKESENPESLYRQGLIDIFIDNKLEFGLDYLEKAAKTGHAGALYIQGIVLLFRGDEFKAKGVKIISGLKKSLKIENMIDCRKNLKDFMRRIWRKNDILLGEKPTCCGITQHRNINAWDVHSRYLDEECEACQCDLEIELVLIS